MMDRPYEADVWVVALNDEPLEPGHRLTFKDVPFMLGKYFHPADWPRRLHTEYIGFRFDGQLQAIARIVAQREIANFDAELPGLTIGWAAQPHMLIELTDIERWPRVLRSGNVRNRHLYCDLDFLHSSETVNEANRRTSERRRARRG